jgi:hypothetical protein
VTFPDELFTPEVLTVLDEAHVRLQQLRDETDARLAAIDQETTLRLRMIESRREYHEELERLCRLVDNLTPTTRERMAAVIVRCPDGGCTLGVVYAVGLRDGGERFLLRARLRSGRPKSGLLNWPWPDDGQGTNVYWTSSCTHGQGQIEGASLLDLVTRGRGRRAPVFVVPGVAWRPRT